MVEVGLSEYLHCILVHTSIYMRVLSRSNDGLLQQRIWLEVTILSSAGSHLAFQVMMRQVTRAKSQRRKAMEGELMFEPGSFKV